MFDPVQSDGVSRRASGDRDRVLVPAVAATNPDCLNLVQIWKSYGPTTVLRDLSLSLAGGGTIAILGPSGSGKTTLLRLIAGLELPDAGTVQLWGDVASRPGWRLHPSQRRLGYGFQSPALWPHLTVAQQILFGLSHLPRSIARNRLQFLLQAMQISALRHRYPHQLSGGEAKRVALARTLAPRPALLLLDEPLTNLDPDCKMLLLQLIQAEIQETGASLIYVTHDGEEAAILTQQRYRLQGGQLQAGGGCL